MSLLVGDKTVISIHYTLKNDAGEVLDSSEGNDPLVYLHGANNIISGLENALVGKAAGSECQVTVQPEEGYGPKQDELIQVVPREMFQGVDELQPGMQFQAQGPDGAVQMVVIANVNGDEITVDANHPLAGRTLIFDIAPVGIS